MQPPEVLVDLVDLGGPPQAGGGGGGGGEWPPIGAAAEATSSAAAANGSAAAAAAGGVSRLDAARPSVTTLDGDPDQIEVSLADGAAAPTDEVLERAAEFFVEHNDNYTVSWSDASHMISDAATDPSKPPRPGWNAAYLLWRLRRIIESIYFRLATLLLILIDIIIVIVDLALAGEQPGLQVADLVISVYFLIEVSLRMLVLRPRVFFIHWYNVLDLVVIVSTFVISCVSISGTAGWTEGLTLFTALRFIRIVRIVRIYSEKHNLETAARQLISQNKRRYQQDGFDLDLTYVTNRVIATSFPSSGLWAAYRNPIEKVARFLDTKHGDHYRVYNLCSEKTYNTAFFHDRVERVLIDDHNVPSVEQMLKFADSVRAWLSAHPANVIVVHCKGGKGRTGTMICVWLIESGVFSSATGSLDYFGHRRTDTNVSKKFQGVETPSQSRYVGYYETVKNNGRRLPPPRPLRITEIVITGMMYVGNGDGSDFSVEIDQGRGRTVFTASFGGGGHNCRPEYNPTADILRVRLENCPRLDGDTRLLFQTTSHSVPKHYEKCPFYFWFHTGFVPDGGELVLQREELDNPHKSKTWHCFRESFSVKLIFEQ
jgi:PTEN phosphatase family protein